jgi:hypothetical protein
VEKSALARRFESPLKACEICGLSASFHKEPTGNFPIFGERLWNGLMEDGAVLAEANYRQIQMTKYLPCHIRYIGVLRGLQADRSFSLGRAFQAHLR